MAGTRENTVQGKSIPVDVIEAILSRLPVKSLIRFQNLSKLCKAIISDPWFSKINYNHLSKSHNLFLRGMRERRFCLMRLEGGSNPQTEAELDVPFGAVDPLCSYKGIVLGFKPWDGFVLWNPSIRRYTMIPIPDKPDMHYVNVGLYHDSRTDDYKIVLISIKGNLVFSCKTRSWTEEELLPGGESIVEGVFVDGCVYWQKEPNKSGEILCNDFRERKTEKLKLPGNLEGKTAGQLRLTSLQGRLCLHPLDTEGQVWVRENDGWREVSNMLKTEVHFCHKRLYVLHYHRKVSVSVGYHLVSVGYRSNFVIYKDCEKRFVEHEIPGLRCPTLLPYSESLFFPFEAGRM